MTTLAADGDELMHHLLVDFIWKIGIVAALLLIGIAVAIIIWKRVR
ncbi:hypothetical protein [Rhodococcus sp. APC 3903]|nr:hypothetical protein [Rhodococcus sp. APC 3903]MDN3460957.1 hypothetical protein [Rhodococcus sp. APC 3903]